MNPNDIYISSADARALISSFKPSQSSDDWDNEEERKKQEREARKKRDEAKKKKEKEMNAFDHVGSFLKDTGKNIAAGTQQGAGMTADVLLKGGALVDEAAVQMQGGSEEEKNKKRSRNQANTEALRDMLRSGKDVTGQKITGTSDDITTKDLGDKQKMARLAGESLNVGLTATSFMGPTALARGAATRPAAQQTGLSITKGITGRDAAKFIAKESGMYGGLDAAASASQVYGETGDPLKASVEGIKAGVGSALFQGAFSGAGYGVGRAVARKGDKQAEVIKKASDTDVEKINVSDELAAAIRKDKKTLLTFDDNKTAKTKPLTAYVADIDRRMAEVDSPEYQANNGLLNKEAAEARYNEIMADAEKIPGAAEASRASVEAQQQLEYYNTTRVDDPFFRKIDNVQNKMEKIEEARRKDIEYLQRMGEDEDGLIDPAGLQSEIERVHAEYDKRVQAEQLKIDEALAKNPEKAAELQMLDEAEKTAQAAKMDADEALEGVMSSQEQLARKEAEKIAQTPNEAAVAEHKAYLETKKKQLEERIERAKVRAENPNTELAHTIEEMDSIRDGSHPLVIDGAGPKKLEEKWLELSQENQINSATVIADDIGSTGRKPSEVEVEEMTTGVVNKYLDEALVENKPKLQGVVNFLQQPTQYLRRMGLNELADLRTDAMIEHARFQAEHNNKLDAYIKQGKSSNKDQIFKALDGDKSAYDNLSAVGQKVVDDMRKDYREIGIKLGIPEEYVDSVDYAPHLFKKDGTKTELLRLQIELAEARKVVERSKTAADSGELQDTAKRLAGEKDYSDEDLLTDSDMTEIMEDNARRFGDTNVRFRDISKDVDKDGNLKYDNLLGFYKYSTDMITLAKGEAGRGTFDHESVHKALARMADRDVVEGLYRDIVKARGGKNALIKKYREQGYEDADWKLAAEEELANTFIDFMSEGFIRAPGNIADKAAQWGKKHGLPESVVNALLKISQKITKLYGLEDSLYNIDLFYKAIDDGVFREGANIPDRQKAMRYMEERGGPVESFRKKADTDQLLSGRALTMKEKRVAELEARIEALIDPDQKVQLTDFRKATGNVKNQFLEKRTGAEGYETNPYKAYIAYMDVANRKINFEPFMQQAAIVSNNLDANATLGKFLREEIRNMSGQRHDWDKFLDDGYNSFLQEKGLDQTKVGEILRNGPTKALRGFRMTTSMAHLGLSVTTAINTTAQAVFMPGSFGFDGTAVGMAKGTALIGKLAKGKLTKQEVTDWKKMSEMGILEGSSRIIPEAYNNPKVGTTNKLLNYGIKGIYSGVIGADRAMRMAAYYGADHIGRQKGLTGKELDRYIYEKVIETNQNFGKYEAPQAWRSHTAKMLGSMVNFIPGAIIRSSEIYGSGIKGAGTIIGKYRGQDITKGEFYDAVRATSNAVAFTMTAMTAAGAYESITGQGEVIPNPFSKDFYNSPALQFIVGNEATGRPGLTGLLAGRADEIDENGRNVSLDERRDKFFNEVLPNYTIPGWSQYKRTTNAMKVNEQGYSETESGRVRYLADEDHNLQRMLTGEYSTPEGREYIENMGKPDGGSLSGADSDMVKYGTDNEAQRQMYYDFYRASDKLTSRTEANKEITELYKAGRAEAAKRKASEYNQKVEDKMAEWKSQYDYLDDDTLEELVSGLRIELTPRSEAARIR